MVGTLFSMPVANMKVAMTDLPIFPETTQRSGSGVNAAKHRWAPEAATRLVRAAAPFVPPRRNGRATRLLASKAHRDRRFAVSDIRLSGGGAWLQTGISAAVAIIIALLLHKAVFFIARRAAARTSTTTDDILVARLVSPARWLAVAFALSAIAPGLPLSDTARAIWRQAAGLLVPALLGWLVIAILTAGRDIVEVRADISAADNLAARRRRTRAAILYRVLLFLVLLVTFCMMLISIPSVRSIGVTLIASAGLAGLAVGAAAQPALKNLIAGIQMAFTEPIRIDDVVIMDGEWGRIEEIRLTFVVVKIWDQRRLIVPVSKFLEQSFQNWTRETSELLGTAFLHVDPTADVPRIRAKLEQVVRENPRWDGRVCGLQVTEIYVDRMELRCLVSARDAGSAFDLRCDVREAMMRFLADEMPGALPRRRTQLLDGDATPLPLPARP
jgi:small-conductance mechanosensitive channel